MKNKIMNNNKQIIVDIIKPSDIAFAKIFCLLMYTMKYLAYIEYNH